MNIALFKDLQVSRRTELITERKEDAIFKYDNEKETYDNLEESLDVLFRSNPNFNCSKSKIDNNQEEKCLSSLDEFGKYFAEVHNGYLNVKELMAETVTFFQRTTLEEGALGEMIPFDIKIDDNRSRLVTKAGQLAEVKGRWILEGLGRKTILKYKTKIDEEENETIESFVKAACFVQEG